MMKSRAYSPEPGHVVGKEFEAIMASQLLGVGSQGTLNTIERFGAGFNTRVHSVGETVVKISKRAYPSDVAQHKLVQAKNHHSNLCHFSAPLIAPTIFDLLDLTPRNDPNRKILKLVSKQPLVDGSPISKGAKYDTEMLAWLFETQLEMFKETGTIGDLAAIEHLFNPFKTDNVIIDSNGVPILTDVDMGKTQSSELLGQQWNQFIADGVRRGLKQLNKKK